MDAQANLAIGSVATAPTPGLSGTSLTLTAGHGARFPAAPFNATVWSVGTLPDPISAEIVRVTAVVGDVLTIARAQEGISAITITAGMLLSATVTKKTMDDIIPRTRAKAVGQDELLFNVLDHGVTGDNVTDDRAAIQAVLNTAASLGISAVYFPPAPGGAYLIASVTQSNGGYPDVLVAGSLTFALVVPPGVSILGAGSDRTTFRVTTTGNLFFVISTLATSTDVVANSAVGDTTFTVSSTAGWTNGDLAAVHFSQNVSDPQEARWTVFATVTGIGAGTITLDTPTPWAMDTTTSLAVNRRLMRVTNVAERMRFEGFHIQGGSSLRHGIGVMWARHLLFKDLTGTDVGSGIINAQFCDNCSARDIYVYKSGAYSNTSKGRGISLSNVVAFLIENFTVDYFEAAALYCESYCIGVRVVGFRMNQRNSARSQPYLIFVGADCDVDIDKLTVTGWNPSSPTANSIVSLNNAGQCQLHDMTLYMPLIAAVRAFPISACTGYLRTFDATGVLRTFNMNRVEKSTVTINLADNISKIASLRDGLIVGVETYVSPGVTGAMLTTFSLGRTAIGSGALTWTAGQFTRVDVLAGGFISPVNSNHTQAAKVTATTAVAGGIPGGSIAIVSVYTVNYGGAVTLGNEPGTEQSGRFTPTFTI